MGSERKKEGNNGKSEKDKQKRKGEEEKGRESEDSSTMWFH